jgi:hypothetical protein
MYVIPNKVVCLRNMGNPPGFEPTILLMTLKRLRLTLVISISSIHLEAFLWPFHPYIYIYIHLFITLAPVSRGSVVRMLSSLRQWHPLQAGQLLQERRRGQNNTAGGSGAVCQTILGKIDQNLFHT